MDSLREMEAERRCHRLLLGFFRCLDQNDYEGILMRMHPEGIWLRLGKTLRGKPEILEALNARSKTLYIHHIVTNAQIDVSPDLQQATLFGYLTVYRHNDGKPHNWPVPLEGAWATNICNAEFRRSEDEWKIYRLSNELSFSRDAAPIAHQTR